MTDPWVCLECGARQAQQGVCAKCGEITHDMRLEDVRDLMRDIDQRERDRLETRARWIGTVVGIAAVVVFWPFAWYWRLRSQVAQVPFLLDQWAAMALVGFATMKLIERAFTRSRFPYVDG